MFNSLKTRRELSAASDNEKNRYYVYDAICSPITAILVTLGLGLSPNNNLSLLKGLAMHHPTCGSRSTPISSFERVPETSNSHANDLSFLQGELFDQPIQILNVSSGKSNCSDLLDGLHNTTIQDSEQFVVHAANDCNTKDIQSAHRISDSGSGDGNSTQLTDFRSQSSSPLVPSPLDWILNPNKAAPRLGELGSSGRVEEIYDRILARLIQLEAHEGEDSLRDDYRIAWLIVRFCQTGEAKLCTPQVLATYKVIGCHPDQVWNRILARRQASIGHPSFIAIGPKPSPKPIDAARRKA